MRLGEAGKAINDLCPLWPMSNDTRLTRHGAGHAKSFQRNSSSDFEKMTAAGDPLEFSGPNLARVFRRFGPGRARQKRQLTGEFSRRQVFESRVGAALVVVPPPCFDYRFGFAQRLEPM